MSSVCPSASHVPTRQVGDPFRFTTTSMKHVCTDSVAYVDALDCVVYDQCSDEVRTLLYYDINISFVTDVVMQ